ncbi:hypothetical protein [Pseudomonas izuensis]|uniref:Uncharacterized protein n=1 Tax=Pseudomonas izuensis TaxID=2684212 RepID=A0ABM7RRH5_9PSED|nr:hypothetical protein [Pseudomonas izuensis]BCX68055.1 hypothetical protein LAB08_R26950 [Pseudomonas izuensis]
MTATLPAPKVPDVGPDNVIDLDKLGNADLKTWVDYPRIAEGDEFWPTWWGRSASGEAVDDFNELVVIGPGELKPEGMPVLISNGKLKALKGGQVFYSYKMNDPDAPDGRGEESLRRFFYVGKSSSTSLQLPVLHFKESHSLCVDLDQIGDGGATLVATPYQAMSVGDVFTFVFEMYFGEDDPWKELTYAKKLLEADIGKPLQWSIPKNELQIIQGGFANMGYRIDYAEPTVTSESAIQTVHVIEPPDTLLPAPEVKGFEGDELDPDVHPDGIMLVIVPYPGIQVGDDVVVYAESDTSVTKTLRLDPSSIDSGIIEVHLSHQWLSANNGQAVSLKYQYAREGSAGTSEPLLLTLRKPLHLPMPIVEGATPDGEGKGYLQASRITGGVYIKVPEDAVIGGGDKVQMHWAGYGSTGSHIADPMAGYPDRFYIPPGAVPANMGKRLKVFYQVTPPGKNSKDFDLEIRDITTGWPTLQAMAPSSNTQIKLSSVTTGVVFKLASWTYMRSGQRVRLQVEGLLKAGGKEIYPLRTGAAEVVTEVEYNDGELQAILPRGFLDRLELNQKLNVITETSFDQGFTYKQFPPISPQLIA